MTKDEVLAKTKSEVFELLKKTIRPEFLNRIDEVIKIRLSAKNDTVIMIVFFIFFIQ
jgi:ATP-dependent Clp protease ATP-binding subunit ClpA